LDGDTRRVAVGNAFSAFVLTVGLLAFTAAVCEGFRRRLLTDVLIGV